MNRDELLKRCVDRRVAHETSIVAVSHLFYVYLLSALKKGQRVEVPNFGTFGTRVVGARRQRRMPYFEVEEELANRVNERYRDLKKILLARYELIPVPEGTEYTGKEPPYDSLVETVEKEVILDTEHEITLEEYLREQVEHTPVEEKPTEMPTEAPALELEETAPTLEEVQEPENVALTERKLMPKEGFDLRDRGIEEPTQPAEPQPTLRELSTAEGPSAWVQILLGFIILAIITFALNQFGVIRLWERKTDKVVEDLPPPAQTSPQPEAEKKAEESAISTPPPTPTPTPVPSEAAPVTPPAEAKTEAGAKPDVQPPATGRFTIQVSSWTSTTDARRAVERLKGAGFDAYVVEAFVKGRTWYRVRVGRYATRGEAQEVVSRLRAVQENGLWVTTVN